jgi:hypothetical protein
LLFYVGKQNGAKDLENWRMEINGSIAVACLPGRTGILVHSLAELNVQIPANSAWFYVLAALAASSYAVGTRQRVRRMRSRNETDSPVSQTAPEGTI